MESDVFWSDQETQGQRRREKLCVMSCCNTRSVGVVFDLLHSIFACQTLLKSSCIFRKLKTKIDKVSVEAHMLQETETTLDDLRTSSSHVVKNDNPERSETNHKLISFAQSDKRRVY